MSASPRRGADDDVDVLVVGAGPSGTSAALHLVAKHPSWASRVAVVDRAVFPRDKLCGGAVTHLGEKVLARMGLAFVPPHVAVREVRVVHRDHAERRCSFRGDPILRVTRREVFDHWLVREAEARGVTVRQGEAVRAMERRDDAMIVTTDRGTIRARVVVGADGSRSTVRRLLGLRDHAHVARLLEVLTPDARGAPAFEEGVAVFEFGGTGSGLAGYYWDFPSIKDGAFVMNRGVFDASGAAPLRAPLRASLASSLARRGIDLETLELKGHPIRTFNPAGALAAPRVLLCGDAAGADPLLGEGISFALAYGEVVAAAVEAAFAARRFDFDDYARRVRRHPLLGQLPARVHLSALLARASSPRVHDVLWRLGERLVARSRWRDADYVPAADHHWILRA